MTNAHENIDTTADTAHAGIDDHVANDNQDAAHTAVNGAQGAAHHATEAAKTAGHALGEKAAPVLGTAKDLYTRKPRMIQIIGASVLALLILRTIRKR